MPSHPSLALCRRILRSGKRNVSWLTIFSFAIDCLNAPAACQSCDQGKQRKRPSYTAARPDSARSAPAQECARPPEPSRTCRSRPKGP
eukprot:scaffold462_cov195-Pinguiococcus_pyrenoidosus.AAC.69